MRFLRSSANDRRLSSAAPVPTAASRSISRREYAHAIWFSGFILRFGTGEPPTSQNHPRTSPAPPQSPCLHQSPQLLILFSIPPPQSPRVRLSTSNPDYSQINKS